MIGHIQELCTSHVASRSLETVHFPVHAVKATLHAAQVYFLLFYLFCNLFLEGPAVMPECNTAPLYATHGCRVARYFPEFPSESARKIAGTYSNIAKKPGDIIR